MKKRSTKSALLLSVLALLVSISMFVGSTYAWFADSVSSVNNIIKSGNLDITVEYKTPDMSDYAPLTADTSVFQEEDRWEPGHTVVATLRIKNVGSLAAKLNVATNVVKEVASTNVSDTRFKLSDYLEVYTGTVEVADRSLSGLTPAEFGKTLLSNQVLLPTDGYAYCTIGITLPTSVGNAANHKLDVQQPSITFGITVNATQQMHEEDSFGDDYDKDAAYSTSVATAAELAAALEAGEEVSLSADIAVTDVIEVKDGAVINLNGKKLDASANTSRPFSVSGDFIINAAGGEIECGAYGLVKLLDCEASVTINGGTINAATDNGSFVKPRGNSEQSIVLNNVTYTDTSAQGFIIDGSLARNCDITINGGSYTAKQGIIGGSNVTVKNASINVTNVGFEAGGTTSLMVDDCEITVAGGTYDAANPNTCVAASKGGEVIVKNSTLTSDMHVLAVYSDDGTDVSTITVTGSTLTQTDATYDAYAYYGGTSNSITVDGVIA